MTDPRKGAVNNLWMPILDKYGIPFQPLTEVEWTVRKFRMPLMKLSEIFPRGIEIPAIYAGKDVLHLPTVKTHGHSTTTGSIKNSFGGLLKEVRHYAHKYMHEVLVDLLIMQKELHPNIFTVMDGTVCGDGAGPRTMEPYIGNIILASSDPVAIDAVAAKIMGFDPMSIDYLRWTTERGLGEARISEIEVVGEDIEKMNFHFRMKKSFVIWGDQMLRKGPLRFLEKDRPAFAPRRMGPGGEQSLSRFHLVSHDRPREDKTVRADRMGRTVGTLREVLTGLPPRGRRS